MATDREIKAVRRVLYDRKRMRKMLTEARSIDVLMNLDPRGTLPPDDIRVSPGYGPLWFVPGTGAVDPGVLEAAERSKRVAGLLRDTRRELKEVEFDPEDKRWLRRALDEHAKALVKRADAWSAPTVGNPGKIAKDINRHDAAAADSYRKVLKYLDRKAFEGVL